MDAVIDATIRPGGPPLELRFCGLPLLLRAALTAQAQGATRIAVVARAREDSARSVLADPRVTVPVDFSAAASAAALSLRHDRVAGVDLLTPADFREAKRRLFEACRKPVDGIVSRHLNRHVSIFISKLLVDTPISPNAMTLATFSLAIVAAGFAARGGYLPTLAAAALMQMNSILDGCDGELARVRFAGSRLGQWLDTIGDDASNVIFWAALGAGAQTMGSHALAVCGYLAAGANALAALANYIVLARIGSGDFYALDRGDKRPRGGAIGAVVAFFEVILKQDFFLLFTLVLAAAGVLYRALPLIAAGGVITAGNSLVRAVRFFRQGQRNSR